MRSSIPKHIIPEGKFLVDADGWPYPEGYIDGDHWVSALHSEGDLILRNLRRSLTFSKYFRWWCVGIMAWEIFMSLRGEYLWLHIPTLLIFVYVWFSTTRRIPVLRNDIGKIEYTNWALRVQDHFFRDLAEGREPWPRDHAVVKLINEHVDSEVQYQYAMMTRIRERDLDWPNGPEDIATAMEEMGFKPIRKRGATVEDIR